MGNGWRCEPRKRNGGSHATKHDASMAKTSISRMASRANYDRSLRRYKALFTTICAGYRE